MKSVRTRSRYPRGYYFCFVVELRGQERVQRLLVGRVKVNDRVATQHGDAGTKVMNATEEVPWYPLGCWVG